jgi:hypothetical protein
MPNHSSTPRAKRRRTGERGQSLVEFALTAPVLILLLLGMVELGNGLNAYLTIVASARDSARLSSQGDASDTELVTMVEKETERLTDGPVNNQVSGSCDTDAVGVCILKTGTPPADNALVKVKVCYDHPLIIGVPLVFDDSVKMCSTTVMRRLK